MVRVPPGSETHSAGRTAGFAEFQVPEFQVPSSESETPVAGTWNSELGTPTLRRRTPPSRRTTPRRRGTSSSRGRGRRSGSWCGPPGPVTNCSRGTHCSRGMSVDVQLHVGGDDRLVLVVLVLVRHGLGRELVLVEPAAIARVRLAASRTSTSRYFLPCRPASRPCGSCGSAKARRIWPMFRCGIFSSACHAPSTLPTRSSSSFGRSVRPLRFSRRSSLSTVQRESPKGRSRSALELAGVRAEK